MSWELVTGMPLTPNRCIACGQNPRDAEGNAEQALFAGGVDTGWGEAVYLCKSCQNVIVSLLTDKTVEETHQLNDELTRVKEELKEEKKEHNKLKKRVKTILKGAKAKEKVSNNA